MSEGSLLVCEVGIRESGEWGERAFHLMSWPHVRLSSHADGKRVGHDFQEKIMGERREGYD